MLDSAEIEEEKVHFANVIATFQKYPQYPVNSLALFMTLPENPISHLRVQLAINNRRRKDLYALPLADQELLGQLGYKQKLAEVDAAIQANAEFIQQIVANPEIFGPEPNDEDGAGGHDERDEDPDAGTGAGDVPRQSEAIYLCYGEGPDVVHSRQTTLRLAITRTPTPIRMRTHTRNRTFMEIHHRGSSTSPATSTWTSCGALSSSL
jgi:hypothetical protein